MPEPYQQTVTNMTQ